MCLVKIEETARIATTPIKVYKVLTLDNRSPFQCQEYYIGENSAINHDTFSSTGLSITGGYLHAFLTESRALVTLHAFSTPARFKIVEMYIPAGTEYWLGEDFDVAAERLYWPEDKKTED